MNEWMNDCQVAKMLRNSAFVSLGQNWLANCTSALHQSYFNYPALTLLTKVRSNGQFTALLILCDLFSETLVRE